MDVERFGSAPEDSTVFGNFVVGVIKQVPSGSEWSAGIDLDDFNVIQVYTEEGTEIEWTGYDCEDDEIIYERYDSYFYPYLDTETSGLDLDGEYFKLFGQNAKLEDIDLADETIKFELDGNDFILEDGDSFEYNDRDYDVDLYFNDGGLYRMLIQLD